MLMANRARLDATQLWAYSRSIGRQLCENGQVRPNRRRSSYGACDNGHFMPKILSRCSRLFIIFPGFLENRAI